MAVRIQKWQKLNLDLIATDIDTEIFLRFIINAPLAVIISGDYLEARG